jgi:ubiquinone/menaquinone biosynthesis C-methylase UbiE
MTEPARYLEIGPGSQKLGPEWTTMNVVKTPATDVVGTWGQASRLPFPDNSFDVIYASHVLEHVWWYRVPTALSAALCALKPGGGLELWVPNFEYIVECYRDRRCGDDWRRFNQEGDFMKWVAGRIFTYGPEQTNIHRAIFDPPYLRQCLAEAGFTAIQALDRPRGVSHGAINLGMKGVKPCP